GWLRGVEVEPDCGDGWDIHDLDAQTRYWLLEMPDIPGLHQVIDRTGGDAVDVGFLDHCGECLLGHSPWFEKAGEIAALPQLRNAQFDGAGTGLPVAFAVTVAVGEAVGGAGS